MGDPLILSAADIQRLKIALAQGTAFKATLPDTNAPPPVSGITQLTGDVTAGPGSGSQAATLANSGVVAGTYGSSTQVPVPTIDAKGRITSITTASIGGGTVTSVDVSGGTTGLSTSGGPITTSGTITLAGTLVVANGGTGAGSFTTNGILLGNSTSPLQVTTAMTDGQLLVGQTASAPLPKTVSGDATVAASGALTIANDAVTYAKMQNVSAASRLIGRGSASGSGDPEEISIGTGLSMSGTTLSSTASTSPGGSDTQVQFNNSSSFDGSPNVTIIGGGTNADVLTLLKNYDVTNQKTAGTTGEDLSIVRTGGPNTKGLRVEGTPLGGSLPAPYQTDIISYWKLEETGSSTRVDSAGTNDLTPINSPSNATGIINDGCDLEASSSQYLEVASNASLQTGAVDFSFTCWIKLESTPSNVMVIACKDDTVNREWQLVWDNSNGQVYFATRGATDIVYASNFGALSTGVWYFVECGRNHGTTTNFISINAGTRNTVSAPTAPTAGSAPLDFGTIIGILFFDGVIDEVSFRKGSCYSTSEISQIYNSGAALPYEITTTPQAVNLFEAGPDNTTTNFVLDANGNPTLSDGINVVVGTSTGSKIGTSSSQMLGFWGATPVVRGSAWTVTNVTPDRSYDANSTTLDEVADVLGTLIQEFQTKGLLS